MLVLVLVLVLVPALAPSSQRSANLLGQVPLARLAPTFSPIITLSPLH